MSAILKLLVFSVFVIFLVQSLPTENSSEEGGENSPSVERTKRSNWDLEWWMIPLGIILYPVNFIWNLFTGTDLTFS